MAQSLFEVVKQSVTTKAVAEHYGIEVKRGGMAKCPFHPDQSPSLKLNDDYYYCFGCGATGDAIDFVARLFQISNKDAAEKIEYLMDTFLTGSLEERTSLCSERNPNIRRIAHRLAQLTNENKTLSMESISR